MNNIALDKIPQGVAHLVRVPARQFHLMGKIAGLQSGVFGVCFAGQEYLGQQTGMTSRQVRRHLRELEGLGLVRVSRRQRGRRGAWGPNMGWVTRLGRRVLGRGPAAICGRRKFERAPAEVDFTGGHDGPTRSQKKDIKKKAGKSGTRKPGSPRSPDAEKASIERRAEGPPRELYAILGEIDAGRWRR